MLCKGSCPHASELVPSKLDLVADDLHSEAAGGKDTSEYECTNLERMRCA
jgi:hypothetical protein